MAGSAMLAIFFAAHACAERVATQFAEHSRQTDVQDFNPWLPLSMPGSAQMQGAPVVTPTMRVGEALQLDLYRDAGRRVMPHSRSPETSMLLAAKYHPDLPEDWKSATGSFVFFDEDEYARLLPHAETPPKLIVNIGNIMKSWEHSINESLDDEEMRASVKVDEVLKWQPNELAKRRRQDGMANTLRSLEQMSKDFNADQTSKDPSRFNGPLHVFGLAFREPSGNDNSIHAMATVEFLFASDTNGVSDPGGMVGVVHVRDVASMPMGKDEYSGKGVGVADSLQGEMLKQIIDWATLQGKLVTVTSANAEMEGYYRALGFEFMTTADEDRMVYSGDRNSPPRPSATNTLQWGFRSKASIGSTNPLADIVRNAHYQHTGIARSKGLLVDMVMLQ